MTRKRKKRQRKGLAGIADSMQGPTSLEKKHIAIGVLAAIGGNIIGAGLGKYSFWAGAVVSGIGVATKNLYIAAAGAGILVNTTKTADAGTNGVDGENDEMSVDGVKDRVIDLFNNYKNRIMLSAPSATQEVAGLGEENVQYFSNPYEVNKGSLDLSNLDRIQEQVASMNATNGLAEVDPTERNF